MERTKQLGVPLTEEEHAAIKKLAEEQGMTMSAYIRFMIRQIIEQKKGEEK